MRVLHVVPSIAPRYGGPSEAALRLVSSLRDAGADALLATTDADGSGRLPVRTCAEVEHEGARCIFFRRLSGESLKLSPAIARWLRRNITRFDVVHIHSVFSHPSLAAGSAARKRGIPYVVRPLGQLDRWSLSQHALRKRVFLAIGGRRLLEGAAAIHWTDVSERERALAFAAARSSFVVPLGVDERLFEGSDDGVRDRTVLFLSRLHPKKNVESLIDAFGRLGKAGAGWRLVVAGNGEPGYLKSLKRLATAAEDRVEFRGWLSGEEKRRTLREAALLVLPSRQENFGIVVAEALAAGTPIVVSDSVALAAEVRRFCAGWVAPLESEGLTEVLEEAMSSPEERVRRGQAGRRLARERYRWASVARELMAEYRRIVAGTGEGARE